MVAGLRSLLAFWIGGASNAPVDPGPPPTPPSAGEQGTVLGSFVGGITDSTVHTTLGMEFY